MNSDRRKALIWHRVELGIVAGLLLYVIVGWWWSEGHNRLHLVETRPQ